ncbi:CopG family transcriptional regulator (plasmid) [Halorubrum salinarum]|jgi:CopG family nickel-responsive transcriptional regulator|uniref:CopG family transcriptional regulator n=1 Tax=Halorubrum salinarum TaxID=2739057 RepID=A0A7D3Y1Z0_9EURY|nr:CopG family transcriptional regulator [Halorubrum salinarum]QKG94354.1 CopG family transcriptional regulator [Halorubrum salinarum]
MRTSLNIPEEIVDSFDETWQEQGLESRSRAGREAIQEYIERHTSLRQIGGEVIATISFDYEHTLVIGELHTVQHEYSDVIATTHHMHHGEWCLETIFCSGPADQIRTLVYKLRDFDAVGRVNVTFLQPAANDSVEEFRNQNHEPE